MNGQDLVDLTVAKLVPITDEEQVANVNTQFVLAAINAAYHTVERAALWKYSEDTFTLTTVAGQRAYDEATDVDASMQSILHVYDADQMCELMFLDERQARHDYGDYSGVPEAWSRWKGEILLHPTPSDVRSLEIRCYVSWADLTLATSPVFPETYHDILCDHAAAEMALQLPPTGDRFLPGSRAEPHRALFSQKLNQMVNDPRVSVTQDQIVNHNWEHYVAHSQDW